MNLKKFSPFIQLIVSFCLVTKLTCQTTKPCLNETILDGVNLKPGGEDNELLCPYGWFRWLGNDHCYFLETAKLDWTNAKKECAKKDAHLIVLNSYDENIMLSQLMYGFQISRAWVLPFRCIFFYL
jgi:type III secretory pathway component EscR